MRNQEMRNGNVEMKKWHSACATARSVSLQLLARDCPVVLPLTLPWLLVLLLTDPRLLSGAPAQCPWLLDSAPSHSTALPVVTVWINCGIIGKLELVGRPGA